MEPEQAEAQPSDKPLEQKEDKEKMKPEAEDVKSEKKEMKEGSQLAEH